MFFTLLCGVSNVSATNSLKIITPFLPGAINNTLIVKTIPALENTTNLDIHQETAPGAGGLIATNAFLNSKEPNRILIATQNTLSITPKLTEVKYTKSDFKPVALISENYMCLAVSEKLNVNTFADLLKLSKNTSLFYGTLLGVNSMEHLMFQYMSRVYEMKTEAVHYKSVNEALLALSRNEIAMAMVPSVTCGNIPVPNIRIIGYSTNAKLPSLPEELHYNAYTVMVMPKNTSDEYVAKFANAVVKVWNDDRENLSKITVLPKTILIGRQLDQYLDEQDRKWQKIFDKIK
jgi:tripartite-type tricarboxylate transporter receptor subunit TctC